MSLGGLLLASFFFTVSFGSCLGFIISVRATFRRNHGSHGQVVVVAQGAVVRGDDEVEGGRAQDGGFRWGVVTTETIVGICNLFLLETDEGAPS